MTTIGKIKKISINRLLFFCWYIIVASIHSALAASIDFQWKSIRWTIFHLFHGLPTLFLFISLPPHIFHLLSPSLAVRAPHNHVYGKRSLSGSWKANLFDWFTTKTASNCSLNTGIWLSNIIAIRFGCFPNKTRRVQQQQQKEVEKIAFSMVNYLKLRLTAFYWRFLHLINSFNVNLAYFFISFCVFFFNSWL